MDKDIAQQAADAVAPAGDVWLDVRKLSAGDVIQKTIDEAIRQQDLVILIWSAHAAASKNVRAEIAAAKRFGVDILPCLIEPRPKTPDPDIAGLLGIDIDVKDPKIGLFRLQAAVMQRFAKAAGLDDAAAIAAIKDYDGALQYINDYRNARGIEGADAANWAMRAIETTNRGFASVSAWKDQTKDLLDLVQSTMARMQDAGNDRAALEGVLRDLRDHRSADTPQVQQVIRFVEGKIESLPRDDFGSFVAELRRQIGNASRAPLRRMVPAEWVQPLETYITAAPDHLERFGALVGASSPDALKELAFALLTYFRANEDVIPDDTNGILGYLDDAWLIHNTIYFCIQRGVLPPDAISADWDTLVAVDPVVVSLFNAEAQQSLSRIYAQLVGGGGGADPADSGGGGSPFIQNATSIDDIYFTVGDKGYLMR